MKNRVCVIMIVCVPVTKIVLRFLGKKLNTSLFSVCKSEVFQIFSDKFIELFIFIPVLVTLILC